MLVLAEGPEGCIIAFSDEFSTITQLSPDNLTIFYWTNQQMALVKYTDPLSGIWQVPLNPEILLQSLFAVVKNGTSVTAVCALDYGECGWLNATGTLDDDLLSLTFDTGAQLTGLLTTSNSSITLSNGTQWTQTPDAPFPTPIRSVHLIFMVCCCC